MSLVQKHIRKLTTNNTCLKTTNMMFRARLDAWDALDRKDGLPGPECCHRITGHETAVLLSLNVWSLGGVLRPTACCGSSAGTRRGHERPEGPGACCSASGESVKPAEL